MGSHTQNKLKEFFKLYIKIGNKGASYGNYYVTKGVSPCLIHNKSGDNITPIAIRLQNGFIFYHSRSDSIPSKAREAYSIFREINKTKSLSINGIFNKTEDLSNFKLIDAKQDKAILLKTESDYLFLINIRDSQLGYQQFMNYFHNSETHAMKPDPAINPVKAYTLLLKIKYATDCDEAFQHIIPEKVREKNVNSFFNFGCWFIRTKDFQEDLDKKFRPGEEEVNLLKNEPFLWEFCPTYEAFKESGNKTSIHHRELLEKLRNDPNNVLNLQRWESEYQKWKIHKKTFENKYASWPDRWFSDPYIKLESYDVGKTTISASSYYGKEGFFLRGRLSKKYGIGSEAVFLQEWTQVITILGANKVG